GLRGCLPPPGQHPSKDRPSADGPRDGTDAQSLAGSGAANDSKAEPCPRPGPKLIPVFPFQYRLELKLQRELDGLARRPGGGDDDDAAFGVWGESVSVKVRREMMIAGWMHAGR